MQEKKTFYITTPIYYPSGKWHLGSAYTTVLADAVARFKRMDGFDVFFLTGTDEHGLKIQERADAVGKPPKQFVDEIVKDLKALWKVLDIDYSKFIRTTDAYHKKSVQHIFERLYKQGDIYKSQYKGLYCVPCESFWTETQTKDGKCPDCGREVTHSKEESYFFRLSKYADRLKELFLSHPEFLQPKSRVNEMLNNFILPGLEDIAVSRTSFSWGIPVSFDERHVVYVWIDALTNYITGLGYGSEDDSLFKKFWPCDVHLMAKEIVRFHSVIWPALLMALDIPLPKRVYGHGWLMMGGDKLSKSKSGNLQCDVVDPYVLSELYGTPALRYVLLKDGPYLSDAPYTNETLVSTINNDLANDLGNLLSRTGAMIAQYFDGSLSVPSESSYTSLDQAVKAECEALYCKCAAYCEECDIPSYISAVMAVVRRANKYVDETAPWVLSRTPEGRERLKTVLYVLAESLRICITLLAPVLTDTAARGMLSALGYKLSDSFDSIKEFDGSGEPVRAVKPPVFFPRLDAKKEIEKLREIALFAVAKQGAVKDGQTSANNGQNTVTAKAQSSAADNSAAAKEQGSGGTISIDEFFKVKLVCARVEDCIKVEKSDKLLKLTLSLGKERQRTVVSGIAGSYSAQEMIGKNVVLVENLAPAKLRGIVSEGMILCAEDSQGRLSLVTPDSDIEPGSTVR